MYFSNWIEKFYFEAAQMSSYQRADSKPLLPSEDHYNWLSSTLTELMKTLYGQRELAKINKDNEW